MNAHASALPPLQGPVGLRGRTARVKSSAKDQNVVLDLLMATPADSGGKKGVWKTRPLAGADGDCPKFLADAIWDFQTLWKKKGVFHVIDGVVDPDKHTIRQLYYCALLTPDAITPGDSGAPQAQALIRPPRKSGTWQITNVWSINVGEVGQVGGFKIEVTQPDEKKFVMNGAGAGFGPSLDPAQMLKGLKGLKASGKITEATLDAVAAMIDKNVGWNVGDLLSLLGITQSTAGRWFGTYTSGSIYPVGGLFQDPPALSRYSIARAGNSVFAVISGGSGIGYGSELGMILFNLDATRLATLSNCATAAGFYGSAGATLKAGVGAQIMLFNSWLD